MGTMKGVLCVTSVSKSTKDPLDETRPVQQPGAGKLYAGVQIWPIPMGCNYKGTV